MRTFARTLPKCPLVGILCCVRDLFFCERRMFLCESVRETVRKNATEQEHFGSRYSLLLSGVIVRTQVFHIPLCWNVTFTSTECDVIMLMA